MPGWAKYTPPAFEIALSIDTDTQRWITASSQDFSNQSLKELTGRNERLEMGLLLSAEQ
ncbi:MAG: hypothetical protein ACRD82_16205 [Blastocatellia bacterium]